MCQVPVKRGKICGTHTINGSLYCNRHESKQKSSVSSSQSIPNSKEVKKLMRVMEGMIDVMTQHMPMHMPMHMPSPVKIPIPTEFPKDIELSKECSTCLETEHRLVLSCRHVVCKSCISKITICPICRQQIQLNLVKSL